MYRECHCHKPKGLRFLSWRNHLREQVRQYLRSQMLPEQRVVQLSIFSNAFGRIARYKTVYFDRPQRTLHPPKPANNRIFASHSLASIWSKTRARANRPKTHPLRLLNNGQNRIPNRRSERPASPNYKIAGKGAVSPFSACHRCSRAAIRRMRSRCSGLSNRLWTSEGSVFKLYSSP